MVGSFSESSLSASMPLTLNDEEIKPRHVFEVQRVCSLFRSQKDSEPPPRMPGPMP